MTTLLIGALPPPTGGVATTTLMLMSRFADRCILLDTAQKHPCLRYRICRAAFSVLLTIRLILIIVRRRPIQAVIYSSAHNSFWEKGAWVLMLRWLGVRPILFPIDGAFDVFLAGQKGLRAKAVRHILASAELIVVQGEHWRRSFVSWVDPAVIRVIPNWVDETRFRPSGVEVAKRPACFKFLYVGWIMPEKGLLELCRAAASLAAKGYDFEISLVGPFRAGAIHVRQRWGDEPRLVGRFRFHGEVSCLSEELLTSYREANAFVFPSHFEGMPGAVLEAMASGLPVIATSVGTLPEVVVDQITGLLVPAHDPMALEIAMADFMDGKRDLRAMGIQGRKRVIERFSGGVVLGLYEELFSLLTGNVTGAAR